jgi:amino acid adenylation domain-containing protein
MSTELEQRLARLSSDQIKTLVRRLERPGTKPRAPATMQRNVNGEYPLSSAQERMWFLCQLNPESRAANNPGAMRVRCRRPLDRDRMFGGVEEVARRHDILRTTFHDIGGRPFQRVHAELTPRRAWQDLRALAPAEREAEALRIAAEEGRQAFDLQNGPLLALRILQLNDLEYMLLVTTHHIVSDGWSNALFARELSAIYDALEQGGAMPALPPFQYIDHVQWEQDWLRGPSYAGQLAYWRERLLPEAPPLALPTDRPRGTAPRHEGALHSVTLPDGLSEALRRFARQQRLGLFHVLMGAWLLLLYRYTGQDDLVIGTSTANRDRAETQGVMGLFINTLAIRVRADGDDSVRAFLGQVQATTLAALRHQELPFEKLIGELRPQRNLQAHPLFQVMYVHQNVPSLYEVPGMTLELLKIDYQTTKFDLNLWSEEVNGQLVLTLYYASALFDAATIARMLGHYRTTLEKMVATPDAAIGRLRYFDDEVRHAPQCAAPRDCVHRRFEARALLDAGRVAVEGGGQRLTYAELNARANRLARHLRALGAGPDRPVALLMDRGANAVVAMLAVMKAGSGYLALDHDYPARKLAAMLADAGATILVTESRQRDLVEAFELPLRPVYLDHADAELSRHAADNLDVQVPADGLAYLMYTSGTSGAPKGVAVEHRHLLGYCDAVWPQMGLAAGDRCATVSSFAADLGNTMIFPALLNGASVVVVDAALATDAVGLAAFFAAAPVQALKIVPSHLLALLSARDAAHVLPQRCLVLGGEACPVELVEQVRALAPDCALLGHYGPTETTIGVMTYPVPPMSALAGRQLPLGFPLAGTRIYLLDAALEPVATGIEGEIYIGGNNVTRGYWNRPELTAQRFIPNPFVPGDRLYRSGDIGKYRADGTLEFIGRRDGQIKLRGFRIEPGEIEAALTAHPAVLQAVLRPPVADDASGQLAAFVHLRAGTEATPADIKTFVAQRLPPQMVPATIVVLDQIPLTANGKIDYARLMAPSPSSRTVAARPPRDDCEAALLRIWRELTGVEAIGVQDNFFDVGGHSLLAVQLMARVYDAWGVRLPLASLFTHGSVEQMAALLRASGAPIAQTPLVTIQPLGTRTPLLLCHPAGGDVLCYMPLSRALGSDFPLIAAQATTARGEASIAGLARVYADAAFTAFGSGAPVLGGWSMGALVAFEMAQIYRRERGIAPTVIILDQPAPGRHSEQAMDDIQRLLLFAQKAAMFAGRDFALSEATLRDADDQQRNALFFSLFKAHQLIPEGTDVRQFRGYLDTMLLHNRIALDYRPQVYAGKVLLLRAQYAMPVGAKKSRAADLGWQQYAAQPVEVVAVPGDHVTMMRPPHVNVLAASLAAYLPQNGDRTHG